MFVATAICKKNCHSDCPMAIREIQCDSIMDALNAEEYFAQQECCNAQYEIEWEFDEDY